MTRRLAIAAVLSVCLVFSVSGQPTADSVARRAMDMLAGPAWDDARYIGFTFNVEREGKNVASWVQGWDRYTGDYLVSGKTREGDDVRVVMNVNTKEGKAWKNGQPVADPKDLLTLGYRRFINDTYWLLMGFKAFDPGVTREYAGEKTDAAGRIYDVVRLSFDKVGLTPGDVYWMWVNRDTGLVEQWHMKLEGDKPEDPPSVVTFRDYHRFGNLLISTRRETGKSTIRLDDIKVAREVPAAAFR
jgi:hypothetical protein